MKSYGQPSDSGFKPGPASHQSLFRYDFPASFRPPVWTGAGCAADGLLGCQAPAADGHEETYAIHPPAPKAQTTPSLPTEIHLQILDHLLKEDSKLSCSFCYLFELASLSRVSKLYNDLLKEHLYSDLHLNFNSSLCNSNSLIHASDKRQICTRHLNLGSKHLQLERRVPLLIRTLKARPDLAATVNSIHLPPGGLATYLTCALEKTFLPSLVRLCPNLTRITGVSTLLNRQFFSGEHYCLDDQEPQQHGILALALQQSPNIRSWSWNSGPAGGRDFWARIYDCHPGMDSVDFVGTHANWRNLETLEMKSVWMLDANMMQRLLTSLPSLTSVALVGLRKKRIGPGEGDLMLSALEYLPAGVKTLEIGGTNSETFLSHVAEWIRVRHTVREFSMLDSLTLTEIPITAAALDDFFAAVSVRKGEGWAGFYLPLLEFGVRLRSTIRKLVVDNAGYEGTFGSASVVGGMELAGLEEMVWKVNGDEDGQYLKSRMRGGWWADMRRIEGAEMMMGDIKREGVEVVGV
jgi:hypothetical protein